MMASANNQVGIIYVLTNPEMPGLVKIGKTSQDAMQNRLMSLYQTNVPAPFECEYAARVRNAFSVEASLHRYFKEYRVNPDREFFRIEPEQVIRRLRPMSIEDFTLKASEILGRVKKGVNQTGSSKARERSNKGWQTRRENSAQSFVEQNGVDALPTWISENVEKYGEHKRHLFEKAANTVRYRNRNKS